jgi:hypothetical protein
MLRLWLFLLTLFAGVAAAFALLAPRNVSEDLDRETDTRLERTHHAASLLLRVNARKWIDTSAQVASDAVLVESLDQATRGPTDLGLVHKTVQDRLKYFNERMKVDLVAATDARGRVIARVGVDGAVYKDSIEGYPLVADALRGLRGDDTWSIGDKLYRVAASPVILRDRYVGTVVIGQEATAELAESMKAVLGAEVALLLHGRVIASTASLPILDKLPVAASAHATELARGGRSAPLTIEGWAVILGSFVGEAGEHQAIFALCAPRHAGASLEALVGSFIHRDPRTLPWRTIAPVGAATLVALLLGMLLVSAASGPLARLLRQVQALSRGELSRLPDTHGGRYGLLARAINSTVDRVGGRVRAEARQSLPQVDSGLSEENVRTVPRSAARSTPPLSSPLATAPTMATPPVPMAALKLASLPPLPAPSSATDPAQPAAIQAANPEPPLPSGEFEERKTRARDPWPGGVEPPAPPPIPGRSLFTQSLTPLPPPIVATDTEPVQIEPPDVGATAPNPVLEPAPSHSRQTARAIPTRNFDEQTSVQSPSEALLIASAHGTDDEIEADYRRVFDDFVASRMTCGEGLEGVTYDKFVVKLRQNRTQLMQRYGCASVRFQVYVKDGKTALKATPVT